MRGLSDQTRLRIVALVRRMELSIGELCDILDQSQPRVSRHVRILDEAGIIERRREGSWVFLRMTDGNVAAAVRALLADCPANDNERAMLAADLAALNHVQMARAEAADAYFSEHAHEWDRIRSLHTSEACVEAAILKALHNRRLGHLVDIGTGTGRMIALLAGRTVRATGVDRSAEMLRFARARLIGDEVPAELVQGDFYALPLESQTADTVVLHQALHYARSPDRVIAEAARVMRPGGHLLIVDFAPHDREELRTVAAHARLGFSDAQMRGWFASSGLLLESSEALDGDPLTVRLWLARRRSSEDRIAAKSLCAA